MHWNPAVGIPLLIIGAIVLAAIWLFGRPRKPRQGRRVAAGTRGERREPLLEGADDADAMIDAPDAGTPAPHQGELDMGVRAELERLEATLAGQKKTSAPAPSAASEPRPASTSTSKVPDSTLGRRPAGHAVDCIISLFVVAGHGRALQGSDVVVAMEKAGLDFGAMGIYHRLVDGKPEQGAVFSVANMLKPGSFDLQAMQTLETPGLSFFMTLPGPLSALDAWDTLLPTAQRLAKLLDGQVLDEERNALGHQRIAHIRDTLRNWDRHHPTV